MTSPWTDCAHVNLRRQQRHVLAEGADLFARLDAPYAPPREARWTLSTAR